MDLLLLSSMRISIRRVNNLMVPCQLLWNRELIEDLFNQRDVELVLKTPLSMRRERDEWSWLADNK